MKQLNLITLVFVCLLLLSCTKESVAPSLTADEQLLQGTWERTGGYWGHYDENGQLFNEGDASETYLAYTFTGHNFAYVFGSGSGSGTYTLRIEGDKKFVQLTSPGNTGSAPLEIKELTNDVLSWTFESPVKHLDTNGQLVKTTTMVYHYTFTKQ